jgi:hypothetical protein
MEPGHFFPADSIDAFNQPHAVACGFFSRQIAFFNEAMIVNREIVELVRTPSRVLMSGTFRG